MSTPEAQGEALHPDLAAVMHRHDDGHIQINHPLVHSYTFDEPDAAFLNTLLLHKRQRIEAAIAARDPRAILMMYERPHRLTALCRHADLFSSPAEFWWEVRQTWSRTEIPSEDATAWLELWSDQRPGRGAAMMARERVALAKLPDVVTIWRGANSELAARIGLSWTTDRDKAIWFSRRWYVNGKQAPHLAEGRIDRTSILAYLSEGGESEVVVRPGDVRDVRLTRPRRTKA